MIAGVRRIADSAWLWRAPATAAIAVLVLTLAVVVVQQREASQRRELAFETQSAQMTDAVAGSIEDEGQRFHAAIDFLEITHPGPIAEFNEYFTRDERRTGGLNLLLLESIEPAGFDAVIQRERWLGNPITIQSSATEGSRLIVTRMAGDPSTLGFDPRGLDVTDAESLFPVDVQPDQIAFRILAPGRDLGPAVASTGLTPSQLGDGGDGQLGDGQVYAMFVSQVGRQDDSRAPNGPQPWGGAVIRLVDVSVVFGLIAANPDDGVQVSVLIDGFDQPVEVLGETTGSVQLTRTIELTVDGQAMTLLIEAGDGYGPSTSLLEPVETWSFGLVVAILAATLLTIRAWQGHRITMAERELASALTVASTDGLTGLLNRVGFVQQTADLDLDERATVLFIDLDGFKSINDLDGHDAGDRVLQAVSAQLLAVTRPVDLVSRLGGDEFIVYLPGIAEEGHARKLASRVIDAVDQVDERLSCSVGLALRRADQSLSVDELLRRADAAMYQVKHRGGRGFHLAGLAGARRDRGGVSESAASAAAADDSVVAG